ncbi:asparagine synthase (glutamine-hydrolyzing) [Flavobacterium phycosphaerae]|uniref:asparagine synthase (glutamine-hydrolyzing) n=1 Tax=Flavobacterium phycosphaerae TaxID=2697515 RepID=UPI00138A0A37|nr:asparagine synthase (glutamine-hydrolyzing) [Flavobacterium phycosphaerae]
MCGIFGAIGTIDSGQRENVKKALQHRGPDGQYFKEIDGITFFHARLSIIDVAGGNQPFETDRVAIVFNGEIYNYKELIQTHNLQMKTASDTEVIVHLYEKMGTACFQELDGMFALALYDKLEKKIFLVRDRVGKKPLYYSQKNGLAFGSEYQAIISCFPGFQINEQHVQWHLQKGFVAGENTVYQDIFEVLPGHFYCYNLQDKTIHKNQYWHFESYFDVPKIKDNNTALEQLDRLFQQAVSKRVLASDFEVGAFLSGGIDSSLVCALAVKTNPNLKTFTVKMKDGFDESATAALIAKQLKTTHHELYVDYDSLADDYEKILTAYGEPIVDESIVPSFYVAKAASEHLRVILNGDGGDEFFGGYRRYSLYKNYNKLKAISAIGGGVSKLISTSDKNSALAKLNRLSDFFSLQGEAQYFSASTDLFFDAPGFSQVKDLNYLSQDSFSSKKFDSVERTMLTDFHGILPKVLFKKMDIATMQNALEGRSPFIDKSLIEWSASLDTNLKINGFTSKYLLRELNKKYIDGAVYKLPKKGFEISVKDMLNQQLHELYRDYLHSSNPYYANFIDQKYIQDFYLTPGKLNDVKRYKGLLALLNLEIWHKNTTKK